MREVLGASTPVQEPETRSAQPSELLTFAEQILGNNSYSIRRLPDGNWIILKTGEQLRMVPEPRPLLMVLTNRNSIDGRVTQRYDFFPNQVLRETKTYGDEEVTIVTDEPDQTDLDDLSGKLTLSTPDTNTEDHPTLLQN